LDGGRGGLDATLFVDPLSSVKLDEPFIDFEEVGITGKILSNFIVVKIKLLRKN
jgi:hypothetical protein